MPTDLDLNRHMNNGKYLSIMDVGRVDLMVRTGLWRILRQRGWYPVVVSETISFRKSLKPWQSFVIESRAIGFDEQAVYVEQRFVASERGGAEELYARAYVRARILKRSGGVVSIPDLIEAFGAAPQSIPPELAEWAEYTRLPSTREHTPSFWH